MCQPQNWGDKRLPALCSTSPPARARLMVAQGNVHHPPTGEGQTGPTRVPLGRSTPPMGNSPTREMMLSRIPTSNWGGSGHLHMPSYGS